MTIAICGSLTFYKEMRRLQAELSSLGHTALVPKSLDLIEQKGFQKPKTIAERLEAEKEHNFIGEHFKKIQESDAILVANYDKDGITGYIGGNTFLEMGIAFYLGKKIYLLHSVPTMPYSELEMHAMRPVILHGNLANIT